MWRFPGQDLELWALSTSESLEMWACVLESGVAGVQTDGEDNEIGEVSWDVEGFEYQPASWYFNLRAGVFDCLFLKNFISKSSLHPMWGLNSQPEIKGHRLS